MLKYCRLRPLWIVGLLTLLSGCANLNNSTTNVEWEAHQTRLATITQYQSVGKLGYISPQERQSLNFQWQYSPTSSQLRMTTFLGQTVFNVVITPERAIAKTYDDQVVIDKSADDLIYRLTGLSIPIEQLNDWLLGLPTDADSYQLNPTHTLATLSKKINGKTWQLNYLSYQDVIVNGVALPVPRKMKLIQDQISINLVITKWTLNP
ncbi:lipoprotein localization protein LolB [Vibrio sinensis]|uniref:Outer-membrane lipoprotein LolB n=1 Tax=Vibrio sinensis TaxID=2302434 RepID=A0A3A6QS41_9VIBR|nr:lipoprotein insertase outer membrane protein LolB [Vibrio sinensis]RJX71612.1 lipoprotein localization protein LolB [Vibrio sinensis]